MKKTDLTKYNNIIKMDMTMKIRYNRIAFVVILLFFAGVATTWAQGIYSTDTNDKKAENTENIKLSSGESGGLFRGPGDDWVGGGDDRDPDPGGDDDPDPIGGGVLILSLLSGAYALVKRKVKRKHES